MEPGLYCAGHSEVLHDISTVTFIKLRDSDVGMFALAFKSILR